MIIGTLKEIKNNENRVGLTPHGVIELAKNKHKVLVQKNAGVGAGFIDQEYIKAGATIIEATDEDGGILAHESATYAYDEAGYLFFGNSFNKDHDSTSVVNSFEEQNAPLYTIKPILPQSTVSSVPRPIRCGPQRPILPRSSGVRNPRP